MHITHYVLKTNNFVGFYSVDTFLLKKGIKTRMIFVFTAEIY